MSEVSAHAVPQQDAAHHHAPPQGFLRKHVFSLDHKVIGKQYYALALVSGVDWDGAFVADANSPGVAQCPDPGPAVAFENWRAGRS